MAAPSAASLLGLPPELTERIAQTLDVLDRGNLRLSCQILESKTRDTFYKAVFDTTNYDLIRDKILHSAIELTPAGLRIKLSMLKHVDGFGSIEAVTLDDSKSHSKLPKPYSWAPDWYSDSQTFQGPEIRQLLKELLSKLPLLSQVYLIGRHHLVSDFETTATKAFFSAMTDSNLTNVKTIDILRNYVSTERLLQCLDKYKDTLEGLHCEDLSLASD